MLTEASGQAVHGLGACVDVQTIDLPVGVECGEGFPPPACERRSGSKHAGILLDDGHDRGWRGELGEGGFEFGGVIQIHEHAVAQHDLECPFDEGRCVLPSPSHEADPCAHIRRFCGETPTGSLEHRFRGIDESDAITSPRQRNGIMTGAATHVDDRGRRRWEKGQEILVQDVRPHPPAQRRVVLDSETIRKRSPTVFRHSPHHLRPVPDRQWRCRSVHAGIGLGFSNASRWEGIMADDLARAIVEELPRARRRMWILLGVSIAVMTAMLIGALVVMHAMWSSHP